MQACCQLNEPTAQQLKNLCEVCLALGVSKKKSENQLAPIKLAFYPYSTTTAFYNELQSVSKAWQKLVYYASRNDELIERVYHQIKETDPMISHFFRIRELKKPASEDELIFCRYDYFITEANEPKIIEYNLTSVSMAFHSQNFQQAKCLTDCKSAQKYVKSGPGQRLADEIHELYQRKSFTGLFLMLVSANQTNVIQQRLLEISLLKYGIKVLRLTLFEAESRLRLDEKGNLKHNDESISVAYYRTGYQLSDYQMDPVAGWRAREMIELSNAIKIPNITFDLMNQKRMQVELSKEAIYSQYLTQEEASLLKKSLVPVYEFDHMTEQQFSEWIKQIQNNQREYVLKPNLEGGSHNIYGKEAIIKLKQMKMEDRKKYILMEKIATRPIENVLVNGSEYVKAKCIYEVSQYGIIAIQENKLLKSDNCGFLIRIKPENVNEGGIMAGVGCLCSWVLEDSQ